MARMLGLPLARPIAAGRFSATATEGKYDVTMSSAQASSGAGPGKILLTPETMVCFPSMNQQIAASLISRKSRADKFFVSLQSSLKMAKVFRTHNAAGSSFTSISFDDRGEHLITTAEDETLQLFGARNGNILQKIRMLPRPLHSQIISHRSCLNKRRWLATLSHQTRLDISLYTIIHIFDISRDTSGGLSL
ncbi:hypothetical protein VP01_3050g1 [Puccinia sorghi]|uniref:Uncharacterized protein n=1 Tax=Puccinia sorghi TaxID=27349 RepID=A0A0L6UZV7_9BASI|nr:hypothetical protein VP01_3050g1 [Puccinia sorghi]